jgi:glycerophosphoryl diester phosphodiesterase
LEKGWQPEDFRWASFSQNTLRELHTAIPAIPTIVNERWSSVRAVLRARQLGTKRLSMSQRWLWRGVISSLGRRGYQLSAYPLNDVHKTRIWAKAGLYGVITDYPKRFKK